MVIDAQEKVLVVTATQPLLGRYPEIVGNAVIASELVRRSNAFTSVVTHCLTAECRETINGPEEFSRDLSSVTEIALNKLDDQGIVRIGEEVRFGDVLAGKIVWEEYDELSAEEKMVILIFGKKEDKIAVDRSLRWEFADTGTVSRVTVKSRQNGDSLSDPILSSAEIEVQIRRELQIGDVLRDNQGHQFVVSGFAPESAMPKLKDEEVEVLIHPDVKIVPFHKSGLLWYPAYLWEQISWRGREQRDQSQGDYITLTKVSLAKEDKFVARSTGKPTVVGQMPFGSGPNPGQKVSMEAFQALVGHGLIVNASEMLTVKADCMVGRHEIYKKLANGEGEVTHTIPEAAFISVSLLQSLGFSVRLMAAEPDPIKRAAMALGLDPQCELKIEEALGHKVDGLCLRTAHDQEILSWSRGRVKGPETIDWQIRKPAMDGLFCERIFGPSKNWECHCGKYKKVKFKGIVCDQCGVEVTRSNVRRRRFGHIELAAPMINPWTDHEMTVMPVLPAGLRPGYWHEETGKWAMSDLNDLYRRVVNRNNRLSRIIQMKSPDSIIEHEKNLVQGGINQLFDNRELSEQFTGTTGKPLCGLNDELKWATHRLFNKRVDYSACGVVAPDSSLPPEQIGLPIELALELWNPLVAGELVASGVNPKNALKLIERKGADNQDICSTMEKAVASRPVIVITGQNEVAVLQPILMDSEAICLSPQTAAHLDLKFAGEKVQIHLPLSDEAVEEVGNPGQPISTETNLASLTKERIIELAKSGEVLPLTQLDQMALGLG